MNPHSLRQLHSKGSNNLLLLPMLPSSKKSKKSDSLPSTIVKNGILTNIRDTKKQELENASKRLNCKIDQMQLARSAKLPQPLRRSQASILKAASLLPIHTDVHKEPTRNLIMKAPLMKYMMMILNQPQFPSNRSKLKPMRQPLGR